jgi:3-dehydroquinate dehydratase type I
VGKICIPIVEKTGEKALRSIKQVNRWADIIELRVDYLRGVKLPLLLENRKKPFIVTNRRKGEGGQYKGEERKRLGVLQEALDLGADYIDVEFAVKRSFLQRLLRDKRGAQIILSFHDFRGTPSIKELQKLFGQMIRLEADVIKIVPFARSWEDNLSILSLIPFAKERRQEIVAFCMGEKGKISRVFSPFFGAAWTYASINRTRASAPGQLTVRELKNTWEKMR